MSRILVPYRMIVLAVVLAATLAGVAAGWLIWVNPPGFLQARGGMVTPQATFTGGSPWRLAEAQLKPYLLCMHSEAADLSY